jgi:hypothetical protein
LLRPYRHAATNVLKGAVEGAIFLALATGLLLRFESKDKALTVREKRSFSFSWSSFFGGGFVSRACLGKASSLS